MSNPFDWTCSQHTANIIGFVFITLVILFALASLIDAWKDE